MATRSALFTFPKQQEIINYIHAHPSAQMKALESTIFQDLAPDCIQKIASYYADKVMTRNAAREGVKEIVRDYKEKVDEDPKFQIIETTFATIVTDLMDKATYTPPEGGAGPWTRRVQDLTGK